MCYAQGRVTVNADGNTSAIGTRYTLSQEGTSDKVCIDSFDHDDTCQVPTNPRSLCSQVTTSLGKCDPSTTAIPEFHPDFCVASSDPVGVFVVPMASLFFYPSFEDCQDTLLERGREYTVPADPDLCLSDGIFLKNSTRRNGGIRVYFDEQGNLRFDFYLDLQCTVQDEEIQSPGTFLIRTPECQQELIGEAWSRIAGPPKYFCKSLGGTRVGERIPSMKQGEDSSGVSTFLHPATSWATTALFGISLGFLLII